VATSPSTPPTAAATVTPENGKVPLPVQFDSTGSGDLDGTVTYLWDFGDGNTSTDASPSHVYTSAGTFIATLTVTDDDFLTTTAKDERVAAFQPHHGVASAGFGNQQIADFILGQRVAGAALGDRNPASVGGDQRHHFVTHQAVVHHDIGLSQPLEPPQREQVEGARPGAHERDQAGSGRGFRGHERGGRGRHALGFEGNRRST
jgi:hypothetical protein